MLAGKYLLEKNLLVLFPKGQYENGSWQFLPDVIEAMLVAGTATSSEEVSALVNELLEDDIFECFEGDLSWGVLRLSERGWARRCELCHYLGDITFTRHDGRHLDRDGRTVGSVWVRIVLNGVSWGGDFPESHISNIKKHLPLRHSLMTSARTNRQITEAVMAKFS